MLESFTKLFSQPGFMPHGHCYLWSNELLSLHVISDALITLSYFTIPFTLLYFVRKRKDLEFNWMFVCFAVFIVACGCTHLLEIVAVWHPIYWLTGWVKALTAAASLPTAILLIRLVPQALDLPSPSDLRHSNAALATEVNEHKKAKTDLQNVHQQLILASRRAGMADIATGVLHNVGNVLNSVSVSATIVADKVRHSQSSNVTRLSDLLQQHASDLEVFITQDEKGRIVPSYLKSLAANLEEEQRINLEELDNLQKRIGHVKEIIEMQQAFAQTSGMIEPVPVVTVLEDALRIHADSVDRHHIEIVREYQAEPIIRTDKHQVLQIVVNLIGNAKHACNDSKRSDKQITLRLTADHKHVTITVTDNGVGIRKENLDRIFNHGFTTRPNGHGFGLHSGANAARDLGGSLTVHSDGEGRGATFALVLAREINLNPQTHG